ncbi:putative Zn finger protein [Streptomyces sp. KhCrAH-43]|uniref:hypothetical protein n=1 Tax=unclassified Streptomyces TaxID=2593676 RepID=UPI00036B1FCE|nr:MULTISPECIES: hypothetical protein [unclassified Streptomyces]MYS33394.1 hypothetical protein [Streptomyces sp. SID4920]MYX64048.1 hypothetical protein [Streptomyces sp. SID8373]RAJ49798.1 putative Zn finger protein [Streptomyces sp. KhCrAH-43]
MVYFTHYGELYGTIYEHRAATPTDADDGHVGPVREAWYGELMQQRRDEQRLNAGMPYVGAISRLEVWPGRLSGLVLLDEDAEPAYPGRAHGYPRTLDVFWPRLTSEQWLLLAADARPHAHRLATESSEEAMLRILDLTVYALGVTLLPTLGEIKNSDCPCRSRKSVCEHIAALIECYARALEREPLTLLLLAGLAPTDFFGLLDDPDHPSAQPYYRPTRLPAPTVDGRNLYYRRQWHAAPPLPPLPAPPTQPATASLPDLGNPAHQLLATAAASRAADLLNQALRPRRNPLVDPVRRLTPERDAARLAVYQSSAGGASPTA